MAEQLWLETTITNRNLTPLEDATLITPEGNKVPSSNGVTPLQTWTVCNSESHTVKVCNGVMQLRLVPSHSKELDDWIAQRHYLGYCPPGAKLRLWVFESNNPIGAMMFGRPSARQYDNGTIWELTRFVFIDKTPHCIESRTLAMARKYIRIHFPSIKGLISYSSPKNNHHGIIYQADNWFQLGWTTGGTWDSKSHPNRRNKDISQKQRWVRSI